MDLVGALLGEVLSKTKACDDVEDVVVMVESIVQKQRIHLLMNNYLGKLVTTYTQRTVFDGSSRSDSRNRKHKKFNYNHIRYLRQVIRLLE